MSARESSGQPSFLLALLLLGAVAVGGYFSWRHLNKVDEPAPVAVAPEPAPAQAAAEPLSQPATPPAIENPIEATAPPEETAPATGIPALDESDAYVKEVLIGLLGQQKTLQFLQPEQFVRHLVATVDNLARPHAPPQVWPVVPTPQRFTTRAGADGKGETIAPENSQRYVPFVAMIESVDTGKVVALYRRHYAYFQQAYEDLGYPGQYFNDRLVQVLNLLIATPVPDQAPAVELVEVKGPIAPERPWVRYEFVDPALKGLSSGQKMLIRTGADNQRRLQAKLKEIRQGVAVAR